MEVFEFKCTIDKVRYNSDEYKIYTVNTKDERLKTNKNNEYVIVGNVHNHIPNVEYQIKAKEELSKFGIQYRIINTRREKPADYNSSLKFLKEVITEEQATTLLSVYPDIVNKVINNDLSDIDLSLTKGIKEVRFKTIKTAIVENFCLIELIDKFQGLLDFSIMKKLYDKYPSARLIEQKLKTNPYRCLCELSRIGFKTADGILLNLEQMSKENKCEIKFDEDLKTSYKRMYACVEYNIEQNELNGHSRILVQKLRDECKKTTPECIDKFTEIIKQHEFHLDPKSKTISKRKTFLAEEYIVQKIIDMTKSNIAWNINAEIYREDKGIILTDEQLNSLSNLCKSNVSILTAPGGAGKSQSVKMIVNMLKDINKTFLLMTPTGKSSEVLANYVGEDSGTIHRQLKYKPSGEENPWGYNSSNLLPYDVVIIDEYSMVDIFLMTHILDAIDVKKTKILFVFDSYQLASVGCGNLAHDLLMSDKIPTTKLTKIFRYNEGGQMQIATKIRNGEQFLPNTFSGVKIFGDKKDYVYIEKTQDKIINEIIKIYKKLLKDKLSIEDITVLSAYNKGEYGTKNINKNIQSFIQGENKNEYLKRGDTYFYLGDKVIQTVNNYKALNIYGEETSVYNGNTGIIIDVGYNELTVQYKDNKIIYQIEELKDIELGYCISYHKSQGSSSNTVIMITPKAHTFMLNSNILYVGATRATKRVYHIGNIITVNTALKKKENLQRNTHIQDIFNKQNNI